MSDTTQTPTLDAALALAAEGKPVFPCGANKAPLTPNGFRDATTDATKITRWWQENPDALIGMPTGATSGLSVLDVDKKDGKQGLEWLKINEHRLPPTKSVKTRSGGVHIFFRHATGLRSSAGSIANGVDIRGDAGYVIYWQAHGGRVLRNPEPAAFPTWLLREALNVRPVPATARPRSNGVCHRRPPLRSRCWSACRTGRRYLAMYISGSCPERLVA